MWVMLPAFPAQSPNPTSMQALEIFLRHEGFEESAEFLIGHLAGGGHHGVTSREVISGEGSVAGKMHASIDGGFYALDGFLNKCSRYARHHWTFMLGTKSVQAENWNPHQLAFGASTGYHQSGSSKDVGHRSYPSTS